MFNELTLDIDHFAHRSRADEFLDIRVGERSGAHHALLGIDRHFDVPAQLAVHLNDDVHAGSLQCLDVDFGPRLIDERAGVAQIPPQHMRDMRNDRR